MNIFRGLLIESAKEFGAKGAFCRNLILGFRPLIIGAMAILLLTMTSGCGSMKPVFDPLTSHRLQAALDLAVLDVGPPGAVMVVVRPDGARWTGTSGVSEVLSQRKPEKAANAADRFDVFRPAVMIPEGRPMAADLIFHTGSIKKTMVAGLVLLLEKEGKLSLVDKAADWLPELGVDRRITIRHLLNHSAGLFDYVDHPNFYPDLLRRPHRKWRPEELTAYAFRHTTLFEPGRAWRYSNTHYIMLGMIIERAAKRGVDDLLKSYIVDPLGLKTTTFPKEPEAAGRLCRGYRNTFKGAGEWRDQTGRVDPSWMGAAGAMLSTADDLLVWLDALMSGRLWGEHYREKMFEWTPADENGHRAGLGVLDRNGAVGHEGDYVFGYQACLFRYRSHDFVVLTNGQPTRLDLLDGASEIFRQVTGAVFK